MADFQAKANCGHSDPKRNRRNNVGSRRGQHRGVKTGHHKPDLARQPLRAERIVDRTTIETAPRRADVRSRSEPRRIHFSFQQRVPVADHGDKMIVQQGLHADFRPDAAKDADIEVDPPFAQRHHVLFALIGEPQRRVRCFPPGNGQQRRAKYTGDIVAGADRKPANKRAGVGDPLRTHHLASVLD